MEKSSALSGTGALPAAQSCPPRRSKAPAPRRFHTEGQPGQKEKGTRPDAFCLKYFLWVYRQRLCVSVSPGAALRLFQASSR